MNLEQQYQERLTRYLTALRNEKPDRVPIRPFVAEFTAKYAGLTCQDVVHDYQHAFDAAIRCGQDFDWDAIVPNMVYVWTGLAQARGSSLLRHSGHRHPAYLGASTTSSRQRTILHAGRRI